MPFRRAPSCATGPLGGPTNLDSTRRTHRGQNERAPRRFRRVRLDRGNSNGTVIDHLQRYIRRTGPPHSRAARRKRRHFSALDAGCVAVALPAHLIASTRHPRGSGGLRGAPTSPSLNQRPAVPAGSSPSAASRQRRRTGSPSTSPSTPATSRRISSKSSNRSRVSMRQTPQVIEYPEWFIALSAWFAATARAVLIQDTCHLPRGQPGIRHADISRRSSLRYRGTATNGSSFASYSSAT